MCVYLGKVVCLGLWIGEDRCLQINWHLDPEHSTSPSGKQNGLFREIWGWKLTTWREAAELDLLRMSPRRACGTRLSLAVCRTLGLACFLCLPWHLSES